MKQEIVQLVANLKDELRDLKRDYKYAECAEEQMYFEGSVDAFEHIITLLETSIERNWDVPHLATNATSYVVWLQRDESGSG